MSNKTATQKWLNIVIFVVSALILAFMFLGQLMQHDPTAVKGSNSAFLNYSSSNQSKSAKLERLNRIVFADFELIKSNHQWNFVDSSQQAVSGISSDRIEEIISLWQWLLQHPLTNSLPLDKNRINEKAQQVAVYFENEEQPILVELNLLELTTGEKTQVIFLDLQRRFLIKRFYYDRLLSRTK